MVMVVPAFITIIFVIATVLCVLMGVVSVARMFWMSTHCRFSVMRGLGDNIISHNH
jgi:hypothetical protein